MKKTSALALAVMFVFYLASPAIAQGINHSISAQLEGEIDWKSQAGHLCNTGAEQKKTIVGSAEIFELERSVVMAEGRLTVTDVNDYIAGPTGLSVTSMIELCAPSKQEYTTTKYVPVEGGLDVESVEAITEITVVACTDFNNLPLPGTVMVTLDDDSTIDFDIYWSGAEGDYDCRVAGVYFLEGEIVNLPDYVDNPGGMVAEVDVIGTAGAADSISVETQPTSTTAGEPIEGQPEAFVTDEYGNPVEGLDVTVSEAGSYGFDGGADTVTTGTDGIATFNDLVINEAGDYQLVFDADGVTGNAVSYEFNVTAAAADSVSVETQPTEATAGYTIEGQPETLVTDEYGNPVEGLDVTVSEAGGYAFDMGTLTQSTGADGIATFNDLVIYIAGDYRLVFDADGVAGNAASNEFNVTAAAADLVSIETQPTITTAGYTIEGQPEVLVTDEYGNPVEGLDVTVSEAGSYGFDGGTDTVTTGADGIATFSDLVIYIAGDYQLVFIAAGVTDKTASNEFNVTAAATDSIAAKNTTATAGVEGTIEVTATDQFGNVVEGETIRTEDADGLDGLGGTADTDENGVAAFTFNEKTAGEYTPEFSAETEGVVNDTATVTVESGEAADLSVTAVVSTVTADGNEKLEFTVTVEDAYGNPVENVVLITTDNATGTVDYNGDESLTTDANGQVIVTATSTVAKDNITFTFTEQQSGDKHSDTATGTFLAGEAFSVYVSAPADQTAGVEFDIAGTISNLEDKFGNTVADGFYEVTVTSNMEDDGSPEVIFNAANMQFINGMPDAPIRITLRNAAEHTLTVDVGNVWNTASVKVKPAGVDPDKSSATAESVANYQKVMRAYVYDQYDNPITGLGMDDIQIKNIYQNETHTLAQMDDISVYSVISFEYVQNGEYRWTIESTVPIDHSQGWEVIVLLVKIGSGAPWKFVK